MSIPKTFVDEYLKKANGATFMGIKIVDLSRDELIACAVCGWERYNKEIKNHIDKLQIIRPVRK